MMRIPRFLLILLTALLFGAAAPHAAVGQSLTGVQGLVTVPTARLSPDGTLTTGANMLNRGSLEYHAGRHHASSPYVALTYLPFLEVGMRLTRADSPSEEAFGDRTVFVRTRVVRETDRRPALLVGIHDFVGQKRHFQATYAVASKRFDGVGAFNHVSVHLGYGIKVLDAELYNFVGVFGGIAVAPVPRLRVMAEYADRRLNVGLGARVFREARVIVGLTDFRAVSGGLSYSFDLPQ